MIEISLYEPEIAGNVGNIIRTCMCLNASLSIIGYTPFDLSEKTLKRAAMDYAVNFKITRYRNIEEFDKAHQDIEVFYVTRYGTSNYAERDYKAAERICLMFGRESTGIPKEVLYEHLDHTVRIPMVPSARSLNLSNSVAIVLAEACRQRGFENLCPRETIKGADYLKKAHENG